MNVLRAPIFVALLGFASVSMACDTTSVSTPSPEEKTTQDTNQETGQKAENQDQAEDFDEESAVVEEDRAEERARMVTDQIMERQITDERVLAAMRNVPRHRYVPQEMRSHAYDDTPLPIGHEQTISQPYIVALMSALLQTSPGDRILEIGTGSGYQAAVLAEMDTEVYSIEIICALAERAERDLKATGYDVTVRCGDGYKGWPEKAPFDAIIVTAAPPEIPQDLVDQLAIGGRLVVPVGEQRQMLQVITRIDEETVETSDKMPVRFVPMVPGQ